MYYFMNISQNVQVQTLWHEDRGFCGQDRRAVSKHFTFSTCTTELGQFQPNFGIKMNQVCSNLYYIHVGNLHKSTEGIVISYLYTIV